MYAGFSLEGKNAVVTGATRGIGLAIAQGFLESGATVTLCGRTQDAVDAAVLDLSAHAGRVQGVAAHVGSSDDLARLAEAAESQFGPVTVLVNNAGTNPYAGPMVDAEDWAWDKTMAVNLQGPFRLSRLVAKKMMEQGGGSIVNIASIAGLQALPMQGIYSVSKAGLIMLTRVLARECGAGGVRVNCICPGVIRTRLSEALWKDEERARHFAQMKALGRLGTPQEVVGAAIYFASDASSFTTGAVLQVDGGLAI